MGFKEFIVKELDVKSIYHLLISGVSPRPIALVGSLDKNGISNLAPFSFFNAFGANPPIIGFSPALSGRTGLPKDTLLNIKETEEFTVSIVNSSIVEQISLSSCEFDKNIDELVPDYIDLIHGMLEEYYKPQLKAYVQSIQGEKVFIKMINDNMLLANTEMSIYRSYKYQDKETIQNRMNHLENFYECCSNISENEETGCMRPKKLYEWSNDEYKDLLNETHDYFRELEGGSNNLGLNKTILIEEVYDSIAVGKIIKDESTCMKILPGDVLEMEK